RLRNPRRTHRTAKVKAAFFNQGHADTIKLGCVIDEESLSKFQWRINSKDIDNYYFRYAVDAWWRLNVGWPVFCLK
ncbi:MAG TPA: hypothetical protein VF523_16200, partial [Burkholderiales bacterium]